MTEDERILTFYLRTNLDDYFKDGVKHNPCILNFDNLEARYTIKNENSTYVNVNGITIFNQEYNICYEKESGDAFSIVKEMLIDVAFLRTYRLWKSGNINTRGQEKVK